MHNDEAVNAIKFRALMEQGVYRYDPHEYHGPTLYYFTLGWTKLTGASDFKKLTEAQLRGLTVLFSVGLIALLPLVSNGLGRRATIFAALLTALSPAMVFYSRYFIHEMLLVFFSFLAIASGWRWFQSRKIGWAILAGAAVGLMQATKETFVLSLLAMAASVFLNGKWTRTETKVRRSQFKIVAVVILVWLAVASIFFSSFFTHPSGILDSIKTYLPMASRAAGDTSHVHSWNFYFERLLFFHVRGGPVWTEAFIFILALVGIVSAFTRRGAGDSNSDFARFLAIYIVVLTALYTTVPYKTPWCVLSFWHGAILLAGLGAAALFSLAKKIWTKFLLMLALLAGGTHLGIEAWQASVTFCADQRNPYVYAQTSPDILELTRRIESLVRVSPAGNQTMIHVIALGNDYWPLPWYLRTYENIGWWDQLPDAQSASIVVAAKNAATKLETDERFVLAETFQIRPANFFELFVRSDLWETHLKSKSSPIP